MAAHGQSFQTLPRSLEIGFVHPALIRGTIEFHPLPGEIGPSIQSKIWITPEDIYIETTKISNDALLWGMTWPLLANDGNSLDVETKAAAAETKYLGSGDMEFFLAVGGNSSVVSDGDALRSTFGDIHPFRMEQPDGINRTFIYPHNANQLPTEDVQSSFRRTATGFTSDLGTVDGDIYVGQTVAGRGASALVLPGPKGAHLSFDHTCGFLVQIRNFTPTTIETDQNVTLRINGRTMALTAHMPRELT